MQSDSIVQTVGLTKHFKAVRALTDFSCEIKRGEVVGLLGPNGSGKSTLVRLLLGFLKPTAGTAQIVNADCVRQSVEVQEHVAYLPGDARLFRTMRGKDVLKFFGSIRGNESVEQATDVARRLDLDLTRWVAFMSTGMRQKLALSVVLALNTPVLILDEPTANLDPSVRNEVLLLVKEARSAGRTVLFSSHVLSEIEEVCDRVFILREGRLAHEQSMDQLNHKHQIFATVKGQPVEIPTDFRYLMLNEEPMRFQVESGSQLSSVLNWLSSCSLDSVQVQPVDLRSIYDQFHRSRS